ncbi:MAG: UDP-2,3-diacylglucosamine diphosphatase [Porticoccaceae bacterium]
MQYHAIWLSDIHLGYRDCKAEFLLDFLNKTRCDTLYLVGDVVDLWAMKRTFLWPASHHEVLRKIISLANNGTRVIYVPGNHDGLVRDIAGSSVLNIEVHPHYVHTTREGKQLLMMHGDEFDHAVLCSRFNRIVGDAGYSLLLHMNRWSNRIRRWMGLPYWSLAYYVKNRVRNARAAITAFEEAAALEAIRWGVDGIICGHIHQPEIRTIDGVLYCNDGDWVESCTALIEHRSGKLELVHWGDLQQAIKSDQAANDASISAPYRLPRLSP